MHLPSIKLIAIFVILCKLAHQNNNNYILLFIAIYLYLFGVQVDAVIFFNYFGLLVLDNIFLGKLKSIIISSTLFIKEQAFKNKFVGI